MNFLRQLFRSTSTTSTMSNSALKHLNDSAFKTATFGMGCFWGCDSLFGAQKGVIRTAVGYSGGQQPNPTYRNIMDHTEVIQIHFIPSEITYEKLLNLFWDHHEYGLTTKIKTQYRSVIFYHSDEQKSKAEVSLQEMIPKVSPEVIITKIEPAGKFYPAEDYHQKYRLQMHKDLCNSLGLNSELLQKSQIAAKVNGYLVGLGKESEVKRNLVGFGLNEETIKEVNKYYQENKGGNLYC